MAGAHILYPGGLADLAARQFGVLSRGQLRDLGLTSWQIRHRVDAGLLHPIHHDVFAVGHRRIVSHARLLAALLTCGPTSFLSHRTGAAYCGLRVPFPRDIEVTVIGNRARQRDGLTVHRTSPTTEDVTTRNGLRVSTVPRLLVELAARERPQELDRLITQAVRKRVLDLAAMEAALDRHARRPGIAALKRALGDYRPRPDRASSLETAFDALIADTDIPPPLRNVIIEGWELDCYWPHVRLAVELDGRPTVPRRGPRPGEGPLQGRKAAAARHPGPTDHRSPARAQAGRSAARRPDVDDRRYLSSDELFPSSSRATISSWIC